MCLRALVFPKRGFTTNALPLALCTLAAGGFSLANAFAFCLEEIVDLLIEITFP